MKVCNTCYIELPLSEFHNNKSKRLGVSGKCKSCTKIYFAEKSYKYRTTPSRAISNADYRARNKDKVKARKVLSNMIRTGKITRPTTCQRCGDECRPEAHHWSYLKEYWLTVFWVCRSCHIAIHNKEAKS